MTTTSNAINEQSSIFLNLEQMAAAVEYLVTCWPGKQMLPDERESWLDVLCMVHPGELKPALARIGTRYRPDPYALLEAVRSSRPSALKVPDAAPVDTYRPTSSAEDAMRQVVEKFKDLRRPVKT
jgi:hypothetical protein